MPAKLLPRRPVTLTQSDGAALPTPRRFNLKSLQGVRSEMASVYRLMRQGAIESQEGTRYVYVLGQIGKMIEMAEIERRLAALEERAHDRF